MDELSFTLDRVTDSLPAQVVCFLSYLSQRPAAAAADEAEALIGQM